MPSPRVQAESCWVKWIRSFCLRAVKDNQERMTSPSRALEAQCRDERRHDASGVVGAVAWPPCLLRNSCSSRSGLTFNMSLYCGCKWISFSKKIVEEGQSRDSAALFIFSDCPTASLFWVLPDTDAHGIL